MEGGRGARKRSPTRRTAPPSRPRAPRAERRHDHRRGGGDRGARGGRVDDAEVAARRRCRRCRPRAPSGAPSRRGERLQDGLWAPSPSGLRLGPSGSCSSSSSSSSPSSLSSSSCSSFSISSLLGRDRRATLLDRLLAGSFLGEDAGLGDLLHHGRLGGHQERQSCACSIAGRTSTLAISLALLDDPVELLLAPSRGGVISRPRKRTVNLTLWPASRKRWAARVLNCRS